MEQLIYIIDNIFEGPIDLLIFLIKEKKIEIEQIPLLMVANQFIDFIKKLDFLPIEYTGNFISTLSELVNIKSRTLIHKENDEEDFFEDSFENLPPAFVEKLIEYKTLKDAFEKISKDEEKDIIPLFTMKQPEILNKQEEWETISIIDLFKHFELIISKIPKQKDFIISRTNITVDEMISNIKEMLNQNDFLLFSKIITPYNSRIEFICLFLAILELVKSKFIRISQIDHFSDIKISKIKD